jgi:hypothetical protein
VAIQYIRYFMWHAKATDCLFRHPGRSIESDTGQWMAGSALRATWSDQDRPR